MTISRQRLLRRSTQGQENDLPDAREARRRAFAYALGPISCENGFSHYLLANFPNGEMAGFSDSVVSSNWSATLVEAFNRSDFFRHCGVVEQLKKTIMPVFMDGISGWVDTRHKPLEPLERNLVEAQFGNTLAFTLHEPDGNIYILAFSGKRGKLSESELSSIYFSSMRAFDGIVTKIAKPEALREKLTAREIECLRWSAAGKSSDDIATILTLSSHTVISYLKSAMRKLEASNRMQAVARAYRYRLL